jgi:hypothetical protein
LQWKHGFDGKVALMFRNYDYNMYKDWFPTYEEYTDYCRCVNKISVGDLLHLYVGRNNQMSSIKTENTIVKPVIGLSKRDRILLGSFAAGNGFWKDPHDFETLQYRVEDFDKYKHYWWLNSVSDGLIAKIELGKNSKYEDFMPKPQAHASYFVNMNGREWRVVWDDNRGQRNG